MPSILPSKRLVESTALPIIVVTATMLAFGLLHAGRRLVQAAGGRAIRTVLVQESDHIANQSMAELDKRNGCRASRRFPLPYQTCVELASLGADSVRMSVRVEPQNRLIASDSVRFTLVRAAP